MKTTETFLVYARTSLGYSGNVDLIVHSLDGKPMESWIKVLPFWKGERVSIPVDLALATRDRLPNVFIDGSTVLVL